MFFSRPPAAFLFLAALLWGLCIPVMKALSAEQDWIAPGIGSASASLASLSVRFSLAACALMAALRIAPWRIRRSEWAHGSALASVTAVSMFLQVDSLAYTSASTAGFLIALYCVLVPVIAWAARLRPMTPILAGSCLLVLAGMAVLTGFNPRDMRLGRGEWENLGAAGLFALQILWVDRISAGKADPNKVTVALLLLVALACATVLIAIPDGPYLPARLHASPRAIVLEAALALLGTALPFALMNRFQAKVGAVAAGFIYCCEPLMTALGAFWLPELLVSDPSLYPNERPTLRLVAGGALILAANLWLIRDKPRASAQAS
jgi:drug/metabolite transporter (DMT)-like permease